jgi:hypothetical protein
MKRFDSKVIDINEFKAARVRSVPQADQLDLLAAETGRSEAPQSDRALSGRDIAHRARMLAHLRSART